MKDGIMIEARRQTQGAKCLLSFTALPNKDKLYHAQHVVIISHYAYVA
jgi:hypothetical protein